jgi:hypothetical protein
VNYTIDGDQVKVFNNLGESVVVKKNRKNLKKIDKSVVESKVKIMERINEYERKSKERTAVLAVNILSTMLSGFAVVMSFFTGYIPFMYASLIILGVSLIPTVTKSVLYAIDVREIGELKRITGYRMNMEFTLPKLKKTKEDV